MLAHPKYPLQTAVRLAVPQPSGHPHSDVRGLGCYPKPVVFIFPSDAQIWGPLPTMSRAKNLGILETPGLEGPSVLTEGTHLPATDCLSAASTTAEDTGCDAVTETSYSHSLNKRAASFSHDTSGLIGQLLSVGDTGRFCLDF